MVDLEAQAFLSAVTQLRALIVLTQQAKPGLVGADDRVVILENIDKLILEINKIGARLAIISAEKLRQSLMDETRAVSYAYVLNASVDIESRFSDHLLDIKLFVLQQDDIVLMQSADILLSTPERVIKDFSLSYPNAAFEIEEAAKCIALNRYTASVFHSMRAAECGIRALSAFLEIPDAAKPAEKNWGIILSSIKTGIDGKWPKASRVANTLGSKLEGVYATLDAIKNPWRNATMHVETIYAPHESLHILRCVSMFLLALLEHFDEEGRLPIDSPATAST